MSAPQPEPHKGRPAPRLRQLWKRSVGRHLRHRDHLSDGLHTLNAQLGLESHPLPTDPQVDSTTKTPTVSHARAVIYAPDMDGQADPGEVVWADICPRRGGVIERRAVLIIGRNHHTLLTLLISDNTGHGSEDNWLSVGSGPWDGSGSESWVRLDKVIEIPESQILRRGVSMPQRRFERISARLRNDYGWR